jgi:hypothetical protein
LLLDVIDFQTVKLHPINLISSVLINLAAREGHRHAALAADKTEFGLSLGG